MATDAPVIGPDGVDDATRTRITDAWITHAVTDPVMVERLRTAFPHVFVNVQAPAPTPAPDPFGGMHRPVPADRVTKSIEDKHYRRVEKYTGAAGTWQEWSFDFVTATQAIIPAVGSVLEAMSKASESTVTLEAVNRVEGISDEMKAAHGTELFTILNGLTSGEASTVVRGVISKVGDRCGFAAFYALNCRFNPKTPGRMLQFLLTVTNPPPVKDVRLIPKAIEDWEAKKASLEKEFGEQISEK